MIKGDAGFLPLIDPPNWFTRIRNKFCLFHKWFCRHGFHGLYYKGVPFVSDPTMPDGIIRVYNFNPTNLMAYGTHGGENSKKKTKRCKLCGHIKKFWNQKAPANPHCPPNMGCPNALKEDRQKMQRKIWKYYKNKKRKSK